MKQVGSSMFLMPLESQPLQRIALTTEPSLKAADDQRARQNHNAPVFSADEFAY